MTLILFLVGLALLLAGAELQVRGASRLAEIGLGLLIVGSRWLVAGTVAMAQALGVSELIVGLTVICSRHVAP